MPNVHGGGTLIDRRWLINAADIAIRIGRGSMHIHRVLAADGKHLAQTMGVQTRDLGLGRNCAVLNALTLKTWHCLQLLVQALQCASIAHAPLHGPQCGPGLNGCVQRSIVHGAHTHLRPIEGFPRVGRRR